MITVEAEEKVDIFGIVFSDTPEDFKAAIIRDHEWTYGLKWIRTIPPDEASRPDKPSFPCILCAKHKKCGWVWSNLDQEWMCLSCLSPASWTERNSQLPPRLFLKK